MKTVSLTVSQVFEIALKQYADGKLGQAEKTCQKILSADPASAVTLNLLAVIHMARGRKTMALAHYDRALKLRPDFAEAWSNRGALLQVLGRRAEALESFDRALTLQPDHAGLLNNRAALLQEEGRFEDALADYDRTLALQPDYPEALNNRGIAAYELGRFGEAVADYDRAIALRPDYAAAFSNRGNALGRLRRHEEALVSYDRALALQPDHIDALNNRGITLRGLGRLDDSLASHDAALKLRPADPHALVSRGLTLHDLDRLDEALASHERALALQAGHVEAEVNRGAVLHALGRLDDAMASFERVLGQQSDNVEALTNRGTVLHDLARYGEALASHEQAIAVRPDDAVALDNRAVTLHKLQRLEEALATLDQAIAARPDYAPAFSNRGVTLCDLGRFDDALASYDRAIALRPDYADAHFLKSLTSLVTGDFTRGWPGYEWRHRAPVARLNPPARSRPQWRGEGDIAGKTILLHSEQGFGDAIQFSRYVPLVAARGARVVLEVEPALRGLMTTLAGAAEIVIKGEALPDYDLHCPLLSLPMAFETRLETIPASAPYLQAPDSAVAAWKQRLDNMSGLKIGLAWSGNSNHVRDRERSMPLTQLEPLLKCDATFVSLQKQYRPGEAERLAQTGIRDVSADLHDFTDTAALIAALDLIITVDTAVAHLAGALGRPVWIMVTRAPDWRWLVDRDDSPWYPTARLFRQDERRDWSGVVARVQAALRALGGEAEKAVA